MREPYFIARFPQHDDPIEFPCAADYRDAARHFGLAAKLAGSGNRHPDSWLQEKANRFARVVRMLDWAPKIHDGLKHESARK